jgi:hypothetical protein
MNEIIAELNIIGVKQNGEKIDISAKIGKPYPVAGNEETDEWACPVSLTPLYSRLHDAHGTGSFQALSLASNLILDLLRDFKENNGKLLEDDGTEFPLDAYWFGKKEIT